MKNLINNFSVSSLNEQEMACIVGGMNKGNASFEPQAGAVTTRAKDLLTDGGKEIGSFFSRFKENVGKAIEPQIENDHLALKLRYPGVKPKE